MHLESDSYARKAEEVRVSHDEISASHKDGVHDTRLDHGERAIEIGGAVHIDRHHGYGYGIGLAE